MINRTLLNLDIKKIFPNPHNPRLNFDEKDLADLRESIKKVGILVPITVYTESDSQNDEKYIILDGERRWLCAKDLKLSTIMANIVDQPTDITQNILYMFNIHYLRKQWELFPTALKLERIIDLLKTDRDSILSSTTGLSVTTIKRCKMLLWFPVKYRDIILYKEDGISTDFFIELYPIAKRIRQEAEYSSEINFCRFVDGMISKYSKKKAMKDVKEFRNIRKSLTYYDSKGQFESFKAILQKFLLEPDQSMSIFDVSDKELEVLKKNVLNNIESITNILEDKNIEIISDIFMTEQFKKLKSKLNSIILNID